MLVEKELGPVESDDGNQAKRIKTKQSHHERTVSKSRVLNMNAITESDQEGVANDAGSDDCSCDDISELNQAILRMENQERKFKKRAEAVSEKQDGNSTIDIGDNLSV
jgi:hypothetical protein